MMRFVPWYSGPASTDSKYTLARIGNQDNFRFEVVLASSSTPGMTLMEKGEIRRSQTALDWEPWMSHS